MLWQHTSRWLILIYCISLIEIKAQLHYCKTPIRILKQGKPHGESVISCLHIANQALIIDNEAAWSHATDDGQRVCATFCRDGKLAYEDALQHLHVFNESNLLIMDSATAEPLCVKRRSKETADYLHTNCGSDFRPHYAICECPETVSCQMSQPCRYIPMGDICIPGTYANPWAGTFACPPLDKCSCQPCTRTKWSEWTPWSTTCGRATSYRFRPYDNNATYQCNMARMTSAGCCTQITETTFRDCTYSKLRKRQYEPPRNGSMPGQPMSTPGPALETNAQPAFRPIIFISIGIAVAVILILIKKSGAIQKLWKNYRKKSHKKSTQKTERTSVMESGTTGK